MTERTQATMRLEMPPRPIRSPAKMKNGTAISANLSTLPNMLMCTATGGTGANNSSTMAEVASRMTKIGNPSSSRITGTMAITHSTTSSLFL